MHAGSVAPGGDGESSWRTAGQRAAHPGCDGGDAAPQAEVPSFLAMRDFIYYLKMEYTVYSPSLLCFQINNQ